MDERNMSSICLICGVKGKNLSWPILLLKCSRTLNIANIKRWLDPYIGLAYIRITYWTVLERHIYKDVRIINIGL